MHWLFARSGVNPPNDENILAFSSSKEFLKMRIFIVVDVLAIVCAVCCRPGLKRATENARPKMQDWKMTENFARNCRVWKMQDWKMTDNILQTLSKITGSGKCRTGK